MHNNKAETKLCEEEVLKCPHILPSQATNGVKAKITETKKKVVASHLPFVHIIPLWEDTPAITKRVLLFIVQHDTWAKD